MTNNGFAGDDHEEKRLMESDLPPIYPPFCQRPDENYVPEGDIEYPFEDIGGSGDENKIRGNWGASIDYYLAVFGFTFALGNLWRFPYHWGTQGGVAYLIPYCVTFLLTLPICFMELTLGQFISLGPISIWKVSPLFKGIGISMVFISCIIAIYYNMITSWAIYYFINSLKVMLPWATCGNDWNSDDCTVWNRGAVAICKNLNGSLFINGSCLITSEAASDFNMTNSNTVMFPNSGIMPSIEYFHNEVLMISSGLTDFRTVNWQLAICLLIAWAAVFLSSFKGIKTSGKVVYITAVVPYIVLFVMLVRFLTLPGSVRGLLYFFKPDWSILQDLTVWGEASVQVFYSLSSCTGGLIMLSSYNRFHNNTFRDVWIIGFIDLLTSICISSILFAAIGFVCYELDLPIDQFQLQDGVQLIFVFFSEAISKLPVAQLWSASFFGMICLVIFNSELFIIETIVSAICDEFPERLRKNHRHVLTCVVLLFYFLGLPLCTSAGIYWIVLLETFCATWPLIIIAFFECMVICWVYGVDNFLDNVKWMTSFYPPPYLFWKIHLKFICPVMFMAILSFVWLDYKPVHYDAVTFPNWAHYTGWAISLSPIIIIVFVACYKFIAAGGSFSKRWRELLCPEDDWGPALAIHRAEMYPLQIPEARKLLSARSLYQPPKPETPERHKSSMDSEVKSLRRRGTHETTVHSARSFGTTTAEKETII